MVLGIIDILRTWHPIFGLLLISMGVVNIIATGAHGHRIHFMFQVGRSFMASIMIWGGLVVLGIMEKVIVAGV